MTEAYKIKIALYKKIFKEIKQNYIAIPELSLFSAVADMVVINGDIHIYEIKSKVDSLNRLKSQLKRYKSCADKVTVVADEKFISKLLEHPDMEDVGIIQVNSNMKIKVIREAVTIRMDTESYMAYWTGTEIKEVLRGFKGHSKISIDQARDKLLTILKPTEVKKVTIYKLKEKYGYEFLERQRLINEKKYKEALEARFANMLPKQITPLMMMPAYLFRDFEEA
ncbi:MAG: sce7726 family protein [Sulfurimonas sp.]|nr:sce7726 family protein [Sulfurimonas sp.]